MENQEMQNNVRQEEVKTGIEVEKQEPKQEEVKQEQQPQQDQRHREQRQPPQLWQHPQQQHHNHQQQQHDRRRGARPRGSAGVLPWYVRRSQRDVCKKPAGIITYDAVHAGGLFPGKQPGNTCLANVAHMPETT